MVAFSIDGQVFDVQVAAGLVDARRTDANAGVQLASFHSTSKGFTGECGRRGGYVELLGFSPAVRAELYKLASISLCANVGGQVMVGLMTNPPRPGDASHARYASERDAILASLRRRAAKLAAALNALPGVTCAPADGALYAFPRLHLPPAAVAAVQLASQPEGCVVDERGGQVFLGEEKRGVWRLHGVHGRRMD
jgi:alanine transaminase